MLVYLFCWCKRCSWMPTFSPLKWAGQFMSWLEVWVRHHSNTRDMTIAIIQMTHDGQCNMLIYNPLGNLNSGRKPGEWSSLEAPHCSSYSMRLSLNYFGVLFLVASMCQFVIFSTIRLKWLVQFECVVMWQNVYRQSPDGDKEIF